MKVSKEARKQARALFQSSLVEEPTPEGAVAGAVDQAVVSAPGSPVAVPVPVAPRKRLDGAKVRAALRAIVARRPRHLRETLLEYRRLVRLELARRHAVVESAAPLTDAEADGILQSLRARFGADITAERRVEAALLGGVRVRLGSDVWDGSVRGRLERLGAALGR